MNHKSILYYGIALFFPVILFTGLLDNYNERHPMQVYLLCIVLFAAAGWLSSKGKMKSTRLQWTGWSVICGIVEASLLYFAA